MESAARQHTVERKASLLRWLDMAAGVAVAMVLTALARPLLSRYGDWLADTLYGHAPLIQFAALSLYSGFIWLVVIRLGGFRPVDLLNESWLRYPPAWLGGVLGAVLFTVMPHLWSRGEGAAGTGVDGWSAIAAVIIMGPAGIGIACFARRKRTPWGLSVPMAAARRAC